jgi:hypothetical protein
LPLINTTDEVLLDEEDYKWISEFTWMKTLYKRKDKPERILIKQKDKRVYLHNFLFHNINAHLIFKQLDNNPFNYCRDNIIFQQYERIYVKKENLEDCRCKPGGIYIGVISNKSVIRSTPKENREIECTICSMLDYDNLYRPCLDATAHENFRGWDVLKCNVYFGIKKYLKECDDFEINSTRLIKMIENKIDGEG